MKILIKSFFTYGACQNTAECRSLSPLRVIFEIKKLRRESGIILQMILPGIQGLIQTLKTAESRP